MKSSENAIELSAVSKHYKLYDSKTDRLAEVLDPLKRVRYRLFSALKEVNLTVSKGEVLGIIGKNGSGKSTLLKIISGIMPPSSGIMKIGGTVVPLIELGAGFNPEFTGLENIYFYNSLHGFSREETDAMLDEILDFSEIGSFIHQPLKVYSSGMMARLAFAVSININPDILILDEVLSVGDEMFRRKCFSKMEAFFSGHRTVLFVSHSAQSINELCTRCVWLHEGELILDGPPKLVTAMYNRMTSTSRDHIPQLLEEIRAMNADVQLKQEIYAEINVRRKGHEAGKPQTNTGHPAGGYKPHQDLMDLINIRPHYIPGLLPKSTVHERHRHVDISDIQLETLDEEKVNVILSGEEYFCRYTIHFQESLNNVYFRIIISNEAGVILGAMNTHKTGTILPLTAANESYYIQWRFRCNLLTGHYFVSVSVHSKLEDEILILAKITDALAFSVIEPHEVKQGGFVLMDLTSMVIKL